LEPTFQNALYSLFGGSAGSWHCYVKIGGLVNDMIKVETLACFIGPCDSINEDLIIEI
jgi:hypothetical protein